MRTIPYILFFLFTVLSCPAQELLSDYRGMVYVRAVSYTHLTLPTNSLV